MSSGSLFLLAGASLIGAFWLISAIWSLFEPKEPALPSEPKPIDRSRVPKITSFETLEWQSGNSHNPPQAAVRVDTWADFSYKDGDPNYGQGIVLLRLYDEDSGDPSYKKAVPWLAENEHRVHQSVLAALEPYFPKLKKLWKSGQIEDLMEGVETPSDLKRVMSLACITLLPKHKDGLPYFTLDFDCAWDVEHGFTILMHGQRVMKVNASDSDLALVEDAADK